MSLKKGEQPEYVYGKPNPHYRGPKDADTAVSISTIKEDLYEIASSFHEKTHRAAGSAYRGDKEEYQRLLGEVSALYAAYSQWDSLTNDVASEKQEAVENYARFRKEMGLEEHSFSTTATQIFAGKYKESDTKNAVDAIEDELQELTIKGSPDREAVNNYKRIIGKGYRSSDLKEDLEETKEFPTVVVPPTHRKKSPSGRVGGKEPGLVTSLENKLGVAHLGSLFVTWRPRVGPFQINFGRKGISSIGLRMGPVVYRVYSRKDKTGLSSINLPGGVSWRGKRVSKGSGVSPSRNIISRLMGGFSGKDRDTF